MTERDSALTPSYQQVTITTRRGRPVEIRHIQASDDALLVDLFHELSEETRRLRFFSPLPDLPDTIVWREARRLADINPHQAAALIALAIEETGQRAIGVARMVLDSGDPTSAEVAIVLRDDYQNEGLGTVLFDLLVQVALVRNVKRLHALSLAENIAVHRLFRRIGMPFTQTTSHGETTTIMTLSD